MRRWRALNRRQTITLSRPDETDGELHRWRLIETPVGGIMLHSHAGPDPGRVLHDHPWWFASFVLRGGYTEEVMEARTAPAVARLADRYRQSCTYGVPEFRRPWSWHVIRLDHAHRIVELHRTPTWTLVVHGRRRRGWGFYPSSGYIDERQIDEQRVDLIGYRTTPADTKETR